MYYTREQYLWGDRRIPHTVRQDMLIKKNVYLISIDNLNVDEMLMLYVGRLFDGIDEIKSQADSSNSLTLPVVRGCLYF